MKKKIALALSLALICLLAVACSSASAETPEVEEPQRSIATPVAMDTQKVEVQLLENMKMATDMSDITDTLESLHMSSYYGDDMFVEGLVTEETAEAALSDGMETGAADENATMPAPAPESSEDSDFSDTNIQVEGVMEADIVKTDGKYIYALAQGRLMIFSAEGEESEKLSEIELSTEDDYNYSYPLEMFLYDNKVAIISSDWSNEFTDDMGYYGEDITKIDIYDVSNPEKPKFISSSGQSGYYNTSRMIGDNLYLITNYHIYDFDGENPETYMPKLITNDSYELLPAIDVCIMPHPSTTHTVVSNINSQNGEKLGSLSLLGDAGEVYMSGNNLYLANSNYISEESEPRKEDNYEVVDFTEKTELEIVRITLDAKPTIAATGTVDGGLLNQFSMDEHNSYFRVVTTDYTYSYTTYYDEKHDFYNTKYNDEIKTNGLYVLDLDLNIVGKVDKLAEDERVYSVRFDGDVGYFVTFRETDPLFTVDLTDPANPTIQSELKIPGFSTYMQVFSEGRLFGIGMDADEETGETHGLKLSMFNTSDPFDVTEMHKEITDEYGSNALYNHKAILISAEKNVIGFSTWDSYFIYGYSDEEGFYLRSEISLNNDEDYYNYDMRGMYIGEHIYLIGDSMMFVLSLDSMDVVETLTY